MDSNKNNLLKWIPFLCSIAFVNAAYLTVHAYKLQEQQQSGRTSFCDLSSSFSCTEVLAHPAAWIFGIPFPLIALFVYPILFILSILILRGNKTLIPVVFGMSVG
jgi:uncharacterized membrane protein